MEPGHLIKDLVACTEKYKGTKVYKYGSNIEHLQDILDGNLYFSLS